MENNNSIAHNQSGNEDHLVVLCERGYKTGKQYIEFTLETEPCESSTIIGVTLIRKDYYFNINDFKNFWGYISSEGKKISSNNNTIENVEIGAPCKINDKVGLLLEFGENGLDIKLFVNKVDICVMFKNLPVNTYYPCAILKFDGMKIRVSSRVPVPCS